MLLCAYRMQALIDREWLQAGHPFSTRHAHSCYSTGRSKSSQPTFLLFLDCVQQLHNQFPCSFEFTTHMLVLLFEHSYFSQFGKYSNYFQYISRNKRTLHILTKIPVSQSVYGNSYIDLLEQKITFH